VSFGPKSSDVTEVASGASLLVDVEFGRGRTLYALSQGDFSGGPAGAPALPNTGALVQVSGDGTFTVLLARRHFHPFPSNDRPRVPRLRRQVPPARAIRNSRVLRHSPFTWNLRFACVTVLHLENGVDAGISRQVS
jgi:hypothetical protein